MSRFSRWVRRFVKDWKESGQNREKVGEDKYGNEYFQYYSDYGLPTKKEVRHVNWRRPQLFEDVHFFSWLRRQSLDPPSETELKKLYEEDRVRKLNALKYNKISKELDEAYYERKAKIENLWNPKPLTADDFEPASWDPKSKRKAELPDEKYYGGTNKYDK